MSEPHADIVADGLAAQVYQSLRQRILTCELRPGDELSLLALSKAYRVSVTPIREALRILQRDGLVVSKPRSGTYVSEVDREKIRHAFEARLIIELAAVEAAIAGDCDETLAHLGALIGDIERLGSASNHEKHERFLALDEGFHTSIVRVLGNPVVEQIYKELHIHTLMMRTWLARGSPTQPHVNVSEHAAILDALRAGDREQARAAVTYHISAALKRILQVPEQRGVTRKEVTPDAR